MKRKAQGLPRQEVFIRSGNGTVIEPVDKEANAAAKKKAADAKKLAAAKKKAAAGKANVPPAPLGFTAAPDKN